MVIFLLLAATTYMQMKAAPYKRTLQATTRIKIRRVAATRVKAKGKTRRRRRRRRRKMIKRTKIKAKGRRTNPKARSQGERRSREEACM
jgi:hypothetical protein